MNFTEDVLPIVRASRDISLPGFGKNAFERKDSGKMFDVVTDADIAVEAFLRMELAKVAPEIAFRGEESGETVIGETFWLCDPIDGTGQYVRGLPYCTTMLALIEHGEVSASVIYDFVEDKVYHAEKGKGAYCNGESIHVSDRGIADSYIAWETHLNVPENLEIYMRLRKQTAGMMKWMCAGYESIMVATGKIEARINFDPWGKDYDFAPGAFLVREAGGIVANLGKNTYDYTNLEFIAANPQMFKDLTEGNEAVFPIAK
ncbi:MAG: inositol monophosphatase [Candidatus Nitrotoga sp.]